MAGPCPPRLTSEAHEAILRRNLGAASAICILQMQEILDLDPALWSADSRGDRINVPGTIADTNWTWRMPIPIERLAERRGLALRLRSLVNSRRARGAP
jgi:4-alpha-glucanotransferase